MVSDGAEGEITVTFVLTMGVGFVPIITSKAPRKPLFALSHGHAMWAK